MRNPDLVPAVITDKRGRVTTVYRRPEPASACALPPPAIATSTPSDEGNADEAWGWVERVEWVEPHVLPLFAAVAGAELANQNVTAKERPTLRIADLADPEAATDNCFDASRCVLRSGGLSAIDAEAMLFTASDGDTQFHTAILLKAPGGEEAVLDFTARQFFPDAAFPLLLTREDWETFTELAIGAFEFDEGA